MEYLLLEGLPGQIFPQKKKNLTCWVSMTRQFAATNVAFDLLNMFFMVLFSFAECSNVAPPIN